jgi:hypothetical protein
MPWIVESGLDLLRASIDGATPESYVKYRVGGNFERAVEFLSRLRDDRNRARSALLVEWKYILFDWNDSAEEMEHAVELAERLETRLTFVRTHTPGRSTKFPTDVELHEYVRHFGLNANSSRTFQLRSAEEATAPNAVVSEYVSGLLCQALKKARSGNHLEAHARVVAALQHDPGIPVAITREDTAETIRTALPDILGNAQFPSTLTGLAAISRELGDNSTSSALLSRYLELAPDAPDRNHVLADRLIHASLRHAQEAQLDLARRELREAIGLELGLSPQDSEPERALKSTNSPLLLWGAATLAFAEKDMPAARTFLARYLEVVAEESDREKARTVIRQIDAFIPGEADRRRHAWRHFAGDWISSMRSRMRSSSKP